MGQSNNQIQRKADRILEDLVSSLFNKIECELTPHDQNNQEDRGIDWIYEIVNKKNNKTELSFYIQNKGSLKSPRKVERKDQKFSKQFNLRNIIHYRDELFEPVIITLCDLSTEKVYWHSIQLEELDKRIKEQQKKEVSTIQIYVDPKNQINADNLTRLVKEIDESKQIQNRKYEDSELKLLSIIEKSLTGKNTKNHILIDLENTFRKFQSLPILPPHIFPRLYPFRKSDEQSSYYSNFTLYTENEELLNLFENIELTDGEYSLKKEDLRLQKEIDYKEKIKDVISIFQHHLIDHIEEYKNRRRRICLHDLFVYNICNCIKCSFDRLEFDISFNLLPKKIDCDTELEELKQIYMLYQFGLIKRAYDAYKTKSQQYEAELKYISYFICIYNIKKLYNIFMQNYFHDDRKTILQSIKEINLLEELEKLRPNLLHDQIEVLNWILTEKYIDRAFWKVDNISSEILNSYEIDQNGGYSRNKKTNELINVLAGTTLFIRSNLLIFDNYEEYQRILMKSFEGFIASHSLQNSESSSLKTINDYLIRLLIKYANTKKLKSILNKYCVEKLEYTHDSHSSVSPVAQKALNLFKSKEKILEIIRFDDDKPNHFFRDKINQSISNLLILLSHLTLQKKDFEILTNEILKIIREDKRLYNQNKDSFQYFLRKRKSRIKSASLKVLFEHFFNIHKFDLTSEMTILLLEIDKRNISFELSQIENFNSEFNKWVTEESLAVREIEEVLHVKQLLNKNQLEKLKTRIKDELSKKFSARLFYHAVICDLIKIDTYLDMYIKTIPMTKNELSFREVFSGVKDKKNPKLDEFINLAYYTNINLQKEKIQDLANNEPYYLWLLNIKDYNYENFDPYWLLHYRTSIYKNEFRTHKIIKEILHKYLMKNTNKSLTKLYLEIWK